MKWYKDYMGYVRETLAYLVYPFSPKSEPSIKFVIFTVGRSGSTLLVSLLHSHTSIFCDDELFRRRLFSPIHYLRLKEKLANKKAYGFKLNTYHFNVQRIPDPSVLLKSVCDMGYVIINLERRNIVRQVISHMYASQNNQFHLRAGERSRESGQIHIDIQQLDRKLKLFSDYQALQARLLEPYSYLNLVYEDDLLNPSQHQETVNRVCNFLEIPAGIVTSDLKKTTPTNLIQLVENYSQLKEYLETAHYAEYLEMD